jgi:micrococcal nuclease
LIVSVILAACTASVTTDVSDGGSLSIASHSDGEVVRKERIRIRGSAPPGAEVVRDISFAGDDRTTASAAGKWSIVVELTEGSNELTFRIGDDDETAISFEITYEPRAARGGSGSRGGRAQATPEPPTPDPAPLGHAPQGPTVLATVVSVTDGDTIRVLVDGVEQRVRYIGIDAPEVGSGAEWMGAEATAANSSLVAGRQVVLERDVSKRDQFGRMLRYVWLETDDGWLLVNRELVRRGFAQAVSFPPDVKYDALFLRAQRNAAKAARGMWAPPPPTPAPTPLTLVPQAPAGNCHPSYQGACLAIGKGDYDCAGGSGDGPNYIAGPITVIGYDEFGLDREGDGIACEGA